jgi:hypothetical protein
MINTWYFRPKQEIITSDYLKKGSDRVLNWKQSRTWDEPITEVNAWTDGRECQGLFHLFTSAKDCSICSLPPRTVASVHFRQGLSVHFLQGLFHLFTSSKDCSICSLPPRTVPFVHFRQGLFHLFTSAKDCSICSLPSVHFRQGMFHLFTSAKDCSICSLPPKIVPSVEKVTASILWDTCGYMMVSSK